MTIALDRDPVRFAPLGSISTRALMGAGFVLYAALLAAGWWALTHLVPDHLTVRLLGHAFNLKNIHDKILGNAALVLLILPSALWLEGLVVGWEKSSARALLAPSQSVRTDLAIFILDQLHVMGLMGRIMMLGGSVISGVFLRDWLAAKTGFAIHPGALPLPFQVVVYFYVYSFFDYWAHRLGHTRLFWPLHRYHHAAEEFCVVNAARIHPAGFAGIFFINIPMPLLGATPEAMIWVNVLTVALGFLIHSRIESGFGFVGRHIIQSPLHHRLHHKLDMRDATGFFGMTPIWDHLFGGWIERQNVAENSTIAIGVDTHYRQGFWLMPDLLRDYRDFWLGLIGRRSYSPSER
jgi:sterol desaturase/sphingolipid hydroxylase (fatty acid hydroxylase superfamily)